jgi:phage tail sheath protein FI
MSRFTIKRPGIYIEEIRSNSQPIEGINTSTTAFVGETQKGPMVPTAVTSWSQFQSVFGGYFGCDKFLPFVVEGFFVNGGQKCYIARVIGGDYVGALSKLESIKDISILYSPNAQAVSGLADALINRCEHLRDRFVIIDALKGQNPSSITKPHESSYAALYYPWINFKPENSNQTVLVPPGGHVAGIYARNDTERGVHKAPANQVIKGAVNLEVAVNDTKQASLNLQGINCIRRFEGRGILVWGARTLAINPEYKYINVRRLQIYIEQSIKLGTEWTVFEPNNETTWAKVKGQIENFLTEIWKNGMLMGTKPSEAYFVKCDRGTMTQNDLDNHRLIIHIGVAPVKPAEFLVFNLCHQLT